MFSFLSRSTPASSRFAKQSIQIAKFSRSTTQVLEKVELPSDLSGKFSSAEIIEKDSIYGAHNYHSMPVVFTKGQGVKVWDPEGKVYYDFLSAYSAVNQGHCHPKIIETLKQQADKLTLSSRAFYNDMFPHFAEVLCKFLNYEMVLPMNSGAEAVETAMKLAKKWGYKKKGIPDGSAVIVNVSGCFHGRTQAVISMSDDPSAYAEFGPYLPGILQVPYNEIEPLEKVFEKHGKNICGFLLEPIQGEAGVVIPDPSYLPKVQELCKKHNILLIVDEVQTGLCRTGKNLCQEWDNVRGDIVILGKAISGGVLPLSAIVASKDVMLSIQPGEHGSTYGGNPLASAVGIAAIQILQEENLAERSKEFGDILRQNLSALKDLGWVHDVRGKGLLNAIEISPDAPVSANNICMELKDRGLLCKPTHNTIIRLAPPLVISRSELDECSDILVSTFRDIQHYPKEKLKDW